MSINPEKSTVQDDVGMQAVEKRDDGQIWLCPSQANEEFDFNAFPLKPIPMRDIARNDGLSEEDLKAWFSKVEPHKPMALIHFTPFRY